MRQFHFSVRPTDVHFHAYRALEDCRDWQAYHESVSVRDLLSLLLLMAVRNRSLYGTVRRFFSFSHETASRAIKAQLSTPKQLTDELVQGLHNVMRLSRRERRRHWTIAIDTHNVCYYGKHTPHIIGGQKKQGTKWYFGYATAVLLHPRHRYTVALCQVTPGQKPHEIVQTLLDQIASNHLKIKGVAIDSGFDSGETILLLQKRRLAYVVPLRRKGRGSNARNRCFEGQHNSVRWTEWLTERNRLPVRTRVLLWKGSCRTMAFAFEGWSGSQARNIRETANRQRLTYRRRFGIETSYRQKYQAQPKTTSRDPLYRLLLQGVAHLLRQVWVFLTAQIARCRHLKLTAWVGDLPVEVLLDRIETVLTDQFPERYANPGKSTT